jgi:hypothetical protein
MMRGNAQQSGRVDRPDVGARAPQAEPQRASEQRTPEQRAPEHRRERDDRPGAVRER